MSFLQSISSMIPSLANTVTNGLAFWGTLAHGPLPPFIGSPTGSPPGPNIFPWGGFTAENSNPYKVPPVSNGRRIYDFNIARGVISPDGVNRSVILVNNQFPGPLIEANWGETIVVNVHNRITGPNEGTTLHWHGFLQKSTQYYDGIPSVSQCPIAPQQSFTYEFKALLEGTSWYHSHYSSQYNAGLFGPIVVYGDQSKTPYDIDLGPVMLNDWFHDDYYNLIQRLFVPGGTQPPLVYSDNNLINGKMSYDCSKLPPGRCTPNAGLAKFNFETGKTHRLRLINTGSEGQQQFSIDGHAMTIIAEDFVPVQPRSANVVVLGVGQRTDVLVKATGKRGDAYWMRSNITCSLTNQPSALAAVYYPGADTNARPNSTGPTFPEQCNNDDLSLSRPLSKTLDPAVTPATTQTIDITFTQNATGHWLFKMNDVTTRGNYNEPLLRSVARGQTAFPSHPEYNAYDFGRNSSIRFIMRNRSIPQHPMHMHGHNFQILAAGNGEWDGTIIHPERPMRRDVYILPGLSDGKPGYLVVQVEADNPGVWPLHCHIAWHLSTGFSINVLERPDLLRLQRVKIEATAAQTCDKWIAWTNGHQPDQIDSGLRKDRRHERDFLA